MGDLRRVGVLCRQGVQAVPVQAPAAEEAEHHANVPGVVIVLRQEVRLHLIDRQGLAGRACHADFMILVLLQRPVQCCQGGRHLEAAAGTGPDLLRRCGQDPLRVQATPGEGEDRRVEEALLQGQLHQGGHASAVLGVGPDGRVGGPGQVQPPEGADLREDGVLGEELLPQGVQVRGHPGAEPLAAAVRPLAVEEADGPPVHAAPIGAQPLAGPAAGAQAGAEDLGVQCNCT